MTVATLEELAPKWTWQEKSLDDLKAEVAAARAKEEVLTGLEQDLAVARAETDAALESLHQATVQGLGMARAKYRRHPTAAASLKSLAAKGGNRREILTEAVAWEKAWERLPDADWDPTPTNTRIAFAALRQSAAAELDALESSIAEERNARHELNQMLGDLYQDCVECYAAACLVFPEETPEGKLVRGMITHTSDTSEKPQPPPGV
jgi:DNA repair exonuclease SbcCD ATPase subunit